MIVLCKDYDITHKDSNDLTFFHATIALFCVLRQNENIIRQEE